MKKFFIILILVTGFALNLNAQSTVKKDTIFYDENCSCYETFFVEDGALAIECKNNTDSYVFVDIKYRSNYASNNSCTEKHSDIKTVESFGIPPNKTSSIGFPSYAFKKGKEVRCFQPRLKIIFVKDSTDKQEFQWYEKIRDSSKGE